MVSLMSPNLRLVSRVAPGTFSQGQDSRSSNLVIVPVVSSGPCSLCVERDLQAGSLWEACPGPVAIFPSSLSQGHHDPTGNRLLFSDPDRQQS